MAVGSLAGDPLLLCTSTTDGRTDKSTVDSDTNRVGQATASTQPSLNPRPAAQDRRTSMRGPATGPVPHDSEHDSGVARWV